MVKTPYKFLDSYSKEDRDIFFGRDKEIEELHSRVFESRILVIYGTSGTGKSSLINCGLANKFNDSDWLPVTVRRGTNINQSLLESFDKLNITPLKSHGKIKDGDFSAKIVSLIQSIYLDHFKPVFIIFDQFEELFIFGNQEERELLINSIRKVVETDLQCRFIFSVREEYLAGFTEFEKIIPSILSNRIRIERMTRQNAISVIEGPCRTAGITIEEGFADKLLEKLNPDKPEIELTYLQVFLDRIFSLASGVGEEVKYISAGLIENAGEVRDLLGTFLEEQISQMSDPEFGMVVLKSFVSARGTRQQITDSEVIEYSQTFGRELTTDHAREIIQKFIRLRILKDKDENGRYELRHDSLAAKIYENITMVEKELIEIRQFLENAYKNYEKRGLYLSAADLSYIAPYEDKLFPGGKISDFIVQSKKESRRVRRRRQNILIVTASAIIIVLSFFTIWALKERSNAIEQSLNAEMQKNSALIAKMLTDSASADAIRSRKRAEQNEKLALEAMNQSERDKKNALISEGVAQKEKARAEELSVKAVEQARVAETERIKAEQERTKAMIAESRSKQLSMLSTAQNLALKASSLEKNNELMGLLAVQAFVFNREFKGRPEDPVIFNALTRSYLALDSSRHTKFRGSRNEIRILKETETGSILSGDMDGIFSLWSKDGINKSLLALPVSSPLNYIGSRREGDIIVTGHDNHNIRVWHIDEADPQNISFVELTGQKEYLRSSALAESERFLASAGRDSTLYIWDLGAVPVKVTTKFKTTSPVRAMIFISEDTLIYALDEGKIILADLISNGSNALCSSQNEKPLSLAWNKNRRKIIAGCSNGSLRLISLSSPPGETGGLVIPVHTSGIDLIVFNSDYSYMATSSWDGTIRFYNYRDFFELNDVVGGSVQIRDLDARTRSLIFTRDNRMIAGLADRTIRIWETSSVKLADLICNLVKRDMTLPEWNEMVGPELPYEKCCSKSP